MRAPSIFRVNYRPCEFPGTRFTSARIADLDQRTRQLEPTSDHEIVGHAAGKKSIRAWLSQFLTPSLVSASGLQGRLN
jgi:hypothetical protein